MITTIVFDAFGTLFRSVATHGPFWKLAGLMPGSSYLLHRRVLMTTDRSFSDFAAEHGLTEQLASAAQELADSLEQISLFDDSAPYIDVLRYRGYKVAVCSNLAHDYGARVRELLPQVDGMFLSYEVGAIKPEKEIFQAVVSGMDVAPHECLFVGDTPRQDVKGPQEFGMNALLVERNRFAPSLTTQVEAALKVYG